MQQLKELKELSQQSPRQSPRGKDNIKKAYSTRMKQSLMTGPQAAQVYYAPAIRNPIRVASQQPVVQRVAAKHADKLSSEKFIFQKGTKMDSP